MYQNIFFDLDGTLVNTEEGIQNGIEYARTQLGLPRLPHSLLKKFIGPPLPLSFETYYGLDSKTALKAAAIYRKYYHEKGQLECVLYSGIPHLLNQLYKTGISLYVATSKPTVFARSILETLQISCYFQQVQGSDPKDPATAGKSCVIDTLLRKNNLKKCETLLVGDTKFDAEGAMQTKIHFLPVLYGFGEEGDFAPFPHVGTAPDVSSIASFIIKR